MSLAISEMPRMAKKTGRPKGDRDDAPIRVERPLASMLKAIADHRGLPMAEVASEMLRASVNKAYLAMLEKLKAETGG